MSRKGPAVHSKPEEGESPFWTDHKTSADDPSSHEIRETVVGAKTHAAKLPENIVELLRESVETIKHISHQNDFTRSYVARAQEVLKSQDNPPTKET